MSQVDDLVSAYVSKHFPDGMALLAGNSVHADKAFIKKDLPKVASLLHYRILDVSSFKEVARRWYPQLQLPRKEDSAHRCVRWRRARRVQVSIAKVRRDCCRALSDIKHSIEGDDSRYGLAPHREADVSRRAELKHYRRHIFVKPSSALS